MEESLSYLEEQFGLPELNLRQYSPLTLAYIGDAIYDLIIRTMIVRQGNTQVNKLNMDLIVDQKLDFITRGLSLKLKGSYNSAYDVYKNGSASVATYTPVKQDDGTIAYKKSGCDESVSYSTDTDKDRDWYVEASLNYARDFGKHSVTGLLLFNQSKEYYYSSTEYPDLARGYVGLVGRLTYDYADKYLAEFNVGYNGS